MRWLCFKFLRFPRYKTSVVRIWVYVLRVGERSEYRRFEANIGKRIVVAIEPHDISLDPLQHANDAKGTESILGELPFAKVPMAGNGDCLVRLQSQNDAECTERAIRWPNPAGSSLP
jgi:hypothetical protein